MDERMPAKGNVRSGMAGREAVGASPLAYVLDQVHATRKHFVILQPHVNSPFTFVCLVVNVVPRCHVIFSHA